MALGPGVTMEVAGTLLPARESTRANCARSRTHARSLSPAASAPLSIQREGPRSQPRVVLARRQED